MMSSAHGQMLQGASDLNLEQSWPQEPDGWTYPVAVSRADGRSARPKDFPWGSCCTAMGGNGFQMLNLGGNLLTDHILVAPTGYLNSWNPLRREQ